MRIEFGVGNSTFYSDTDFGLVIASVIIGEPPVKENYVDVPGASGSLDYTDYFGEPIYGNRLITIECGFRITDRFAQESALRNAIHGKKCKITFDTDETHYYMGRVAIGDIEKYVKVAKLTITINAEPYKLKSTQTVVQKTLTTTSQTITLTNEHRTCIPEVVVMRETVITVGQTNYTLAAGTHYLAALLLGAGTTTISAKTTSGQGILKITYQEASL